MSCSAHCCRTIAFAPFSSLSLSLSLSLLSGLTFHPDWFAFFDAVSEAFSLSISHLLLAKKNKKLFVSNFQRNVHYLFYVRDSLSYYIQAAAGYLYPYDEIIRMTNPIGSGNENDEPLVVF